MAKIAVESRGLQPEEGAAESSRLTWRVLARGDGWNVADVVCTAGPRDRAFEELHESVTVAIVVSGTFQYRADSGCDVMTPGSILLGNAGRPFECGHEHGTGDRCLSFQFSREYFERLAADAGGTRAGRTFEALRLPPLRPLSALVARTSAGLSVDADVPWDELSVQVAATAFAIDKGVPPTAGNPQPSSASRVTRVVRRIESEPLGELALGKLAQEAGLSPYHFLRSFLQVTGLTPHQYVRRSRLRRAAIRLALGKEKVLDVALDCGFGDVSNFNRAFRAEFRMNPSAYRAHEGARRLFARPARQP